MKKLTLLIVLSFIIQSTSLSQGCLPNGITFTSQIEIDNFQTNNPNCTEIEGDVIIEGNDITNLNGLSVLTTIGGDLWINNSNSLTSLTGLDNVTFIGEHVVIYKNNTLTSLTGLEGLTSIGGELAIGIYSGGNPALTSLTGLEGITSIGGAIYIRHNLTLTSLTGLNNVTSIEGLLGIVNNTALTSLSGLDNIDAASINDLRIYWNSSLSTCEVQSVCAYLASPGGAIDIYDNAAGCNSQDEVDEACWFVGIVENNPSTEFSIYPNPVRKEVFISINNGGIIKELNIYNQIGQKVINTNSLTSSIDVSMLRQGMYVIELIVNDVKIRNKLIIK